MELSLHYAAYIWLYCSMSGVILFHDTWTFLFFWEMMTGATFILVIFEGEKKEKLKPAINYLIQMHVCFFVLLTAFSIADSYSVLSGFEAVCDYFEHNGNLTLFLLFFIGFGIKAGFVPLHTWLPEVHPSAPGNVSGFMSGAVIKMGIYGLLRVVCSLQNNLFEIAVFLLVISAVTGIYGISKATRQKDIKRLLAFSSIENIGIIGIGLGLGIIGVQWQLPSLSFAGYAGALLHTFNHSTFKSILFFSAANLCKSTGTQIMDRMGGAIRNMPCTAAVFLLGSTAICALPPLSGFVSEFILYSGLFASFTGVEPEKAVTLLFVIIALVLIGGISIIAFTKSFGISFLGVCRNPLHAAEKEHKSMVLPLILPLAAIVFVGFFPFVAIKFISKTVFDVFGVRYSMFCDSQLLSLQNLGIFGSVFTVSCIFIWYIRKKILSKRTITTGTTWGCGYTSPTPKLQYTASSFSSNFARIASHKNTDSAGETVAETELFPANRTHINRYGNKKQLYLIKNASNKLAKLAIFQTGKIQHYVLFALLFMAIILVLSYAGLI
jgi:formate hydrogenlyase subunit 3/multisubunit Na+/H+ antiporter MnhD subunit